MSQSRQETLELRSAAHPSQPNTAFPRSRRLLEANQYNRTFAKGKRIKGREMTLVAAANGLLHARLGLAVSKRALPKAHERNRVKRLVRESFRVHTDLPAVDCVFMARSGLSRMSNSELAQCLEKLWRQIRKSF